MINKPLASNLKRIIAILSASILLGGCAYNAVNEEPKMPEDKKLVIYTSHKANIYEPIIKEFEERSGIWVKVVTGGTNEILSKVSEEGSEEAEAALTALKFTRIVLNPMRLLRKQISTVPTVPRNMHTPFFQSYPSYLSIMKNL